MTLSRTLFLLLLAAPLAAQTTTVFPAEYAGVAEGPLNSPNQPLSNGVSRSMLVYDRAELAIPDGASITHVGFRQDATLTTMDAGRALQLEIRMGYTSRSPIAPSTTFETNYSSPSTTVFGPALFTLPNLRDPQNPLPNGQFFIPLATPFLFLPPAGQHLVVEYRVAGNSGGGTSFNYRLDRADYHSPVVLGPAGCQHSGGQTPNLALGTVRVGSSLSVTLSTAPANSFAAIVVQPGGRLQTPFSLAPFVSGISPTCLGQVTPAGISTLSGVTSGQGGLSLTYSIPNIPALNDLFLPHQALVFDFFAPGGLVVSNGAEVQIGQKPQAALVAAQGPPSTTTTGSLTANYCPVSFFRYQ
jgi:hypothetical protein